MKHKIWIFTLVYGFVFTFGLTACEVQLKDKQNTPQPLQMAATQPDYVIDGPIVLANHENIQVERLVLTKNAMIITEDKNLVIVAKEIVSDGAVIRNFAEGQKAFWESSGRSGGSIHITVAKAQGNLQVHLQGEAGGSGKNGCITFPGKHPGCAGTSGGIGGNAGSLRAEILDGTSFNLSYHNEEGAPGVAGVRGAVPYGTPDAIHPPCAADVQNGIDGKPGLKGQVCLKLGTEEKFLCE